MKLILAQSDTDQTIHFKGEFSMDELFNASNAAQLHFIQAASRPGSPYEVALALAGALIVLSRAAAGSPNNARDPISHGIEASPTENAGCADLSGILTNRLG